MSDIWEMHKRAEEKKEQLRKEKPELFRCITEYNAIWQQTLAVKLNIAAYADEVTKANIENYYPDMLPMIEKVLETLYRIEIEAYAECKKLALYAE